MSPPQAELVGHFVAGDAFRRGQGLLEAIANRFAEGRAEIRVAQQRAQPVVDEAFDQVLEFGQA
jgi:hypothetical protein